MSSVSFGGIGSTITVPKLTETVRHEAQPLQGLSQLASPPTGKALGLGRGDTVKEVFYPNITNTGGELSENEVIPRGSITPFSMTYTVKEYGNSLNYTGKLKDLAELPVEDKFVQALLDDMRKLQNNQAYAQMAATKWIATFNSTANEFRTDGVVASFTNAADTNLSKANLRYLVKQAKKRNIPFFDGESYVVSTGVESADALCYDSGITTELSQSNEGRASLNGEIGRVVECRILVDNHALPVAKTITASNILDETYLVGADAFINEYALPPEIRAEDADFGRQLAVAYYFIAAWKKIYSQDVNSKEHIIKVTSK